ncbi:sulfite exporter TauE/SafE family protein [Saccharopolyspora sp. HNM0983]|uniref:Probable membrane transporter protein n=1 Tax=Saccharopolyspora montiporae TaxID=2781240 RepID=A0A929BA35_9PSEU|nr:sulfite exporter TauE/SafE family protein [Saccharopolyspora sp. HNM0983]MBE9374231.1 sulfite exporter TauE/SafE family protein [Saccharopolyspora sp. HNM0983]
MIAAAGIVLGLCMGLLGAGGSVLALPVLVHGAGQSPATAIPTALAVVALSSLGGLLSRPRLRQVRWPVAAVFAASGVPGSFAGTALSRTLDDDLLLLGFSVLMAVVAVRMLRGDDAGVDHCHTAGGAFDWRRCLPRSALTGAGVGVLTGLFGVGGGFLVVPALTVLLGLSAGQAVATSLVVVTVNSAGGLLAHLSDLQGVDLGVLAVFAVTALLASVPAGRLAHRLPGELVRRAFAVVVLLVAVGMAAGALLG